MIYEITDTKTVSPLFCNWEETLIWSCLQGIMGKIYADDRDQPAAAMAVIGDFIFFAGKPNPELISYKPDWYTKPYVIMVPQSEDWTHMISRLYGSRATMATRYALKKEPDVFNITQLKQAVEALPEEYEISMIDQNLYELCKSEIWTTDLVSQFPTYEDFRRLGIGVVICQNHTILSGASSYTRYRDGIEIQINTRDGFRRRGLAYICASKLILECLERNLYPSWDAQNQASVALAEKLGYHYSHPYAVLEIRNY